METINKKISEDKPVIDLSEFAMTNTFEQRVNDYLEDSIKPMESYNFGGNQ